MVSALGFVLSSLVATMYAVIAFVVVPRLIRHAWNRSPTLGLARWGAVAFFAGCAVTHGALALQLWDHLRGSASMPGMSPADDTSMLLTHVLPHTVQLVGGGVFIGISRHSLTFSVVRRSDAEQLQERADQFRGAFELAPLGVALVGADPGRESTLLQVNPSLCELLGYPDDSLLRGRHYLEFVAIPDRDRVEEQRRLLASGEETDDLEARLCGRHGPVWVSLHASLVQQATGQHFLVVQVRDITEDRRQQQELRYLAEHDSLTQVLNRHRFQAEVDAVAAQVRDGTAPAALLVVDLDHFKYVNDTYGHAVGDRVLQDVAGHLDRQLQPEHHIGRLGGDEFGVLCPGLSPAQARRLGEELLVALRGVTVLAPDGRPVRVTASVGVIDIPATPAAGEQLLADADMAMYEAKNAGRARVWVGGHTGLANARSRLAWGERIQHALETDGFRLWEQPILNLITGTCDRSEVLLRMVDPHDRSTIIAPGQFLAAAEALGHIQAIDRWVFHRAVDLLTARQQLGDLRAVEVNLSGASLTDEPLIDDLTDLIAAAPIDPTSLIVEITETAAIGNFDLARAVASRLTDLGCRFVLDDFGAGFGSFYYLKHLPFDGIKIDGEFVKDLPRSRTDRLTVEAITTLAHGIGKEVTAEFVQDLETINLLRSYGVDFAQGYHIARPHPLTETDPSDTAGGTARTPTHLAGPRPAAP